MAMRMGVGPWEVGKEIRRRGRREMLGFVCVVVGMGGIVGVSLSN